MTNIFRTILKNRKFQKVTFSIFLRKQFQISKNQLFQLFRKNVDFLKMLMFKKNRKSYFLKFSIFQNLSKNIIHRKNKYFRVNFFLSSLMYNLSEWCRGTPTVPPVGAVNVPPKIRKSRKFIF